MTNKTIFEEALDFHKNGKPGKVALQLTKPLETQHDLAMAYSPGVAECCTEISKDYDKIYDYMIKFMITQQKVITLLLLVMVQLF